MQALIPITYSRNGVGEMFADITLSLEEVRKAFAQSISERLNIPINADDILSVDYDLDDEGEFTGLTFEVEIPPAQATPPEEIKAVSSATAEGIAAADIYSE